MNSKINRRLSTCPPAGVSPEQRISAPLSQQNRFISRPLNLEQLTEFAAQFAPLLHAGDTILLSGELGAGKTALVQLLARQLDVSDEQYVSSPSFALMHEYSGRLPIYHMDLYRLSDEEDVEAAGLLDYFDHQGICFVEWPVRLGSAMPRQYLDLEIHIHDQAHRRLTFTFHGEDWQQRRDRIAQLLKAA